MTEKEHGSVAMGDGREEDGMPERIWAGDFDRHGFGHCVAGMQGGLYEEYVRADLATISRLAQKPVAEIVASSSTFVSHVIGFDISFRTTNLPIGTKLYAAPQPAHGTSATERVPTTAGQGVEADRLRRMVERRDEFIIANGLWAEFNKVRRNED